MELLIGLIIVFVYAAIKGTQRVNEDKAYCKENGIDYDEFLYTRADKAAKRRARRIPKSTRNYVMHRDNYECQYCGSKYDLHIDHIYPFSRGGGNSPDNLQVLCSKCNLEKSDAVN